jgi:hypothetical protein
VFADEPYDFFATLTVPKSAKLGKCATKVCRLESECVPGRIVVVKPHGAIFSAYAQLELIGQSIELPAPRTGMRGFVTTSSNLPFSRISHSVLSI